jgi:hypothetical protein
VQTIVSLLWPTNCPFVINDPLSMLELTHTHNNSIQHDSMKEYLVIKQNNQKLFLFKNKFVAQKFNDDETYCLVHDE